VERGIAAVLKFSGRATEDIVREKEKALRSSLINDGLKPKTGCLFARYNDPGRTRSFVMVWYGIRTLLPLFCPDILFKNDSNHLDNLKYDYWVTLTLVSHGEKLIKKHNWETRWGARG